MALTTTTSITGTTITTYTYDAANRLTAVDGVPYTWDARGNLLSNGTFSYTYNAAGRMVRAESLAATVVYTYNASGLRVGQNVDGVERLFAWDWASGIPEMLSDGENVYLLGAETLGHWDGSDPAQSEVERWAYYLPDVLSSVRQVVNGERAVIDSRDWTPFGVDSDSQRTGLGFTGEWWDANVELFYLRARYMDPKRGRFLQQDLWPGDMYQPLTMQPYVYTANDPVNATDPSGLVVQPPSGRQPSWLDQGAPASLLVELAKAAYWKVQCVFRGDDGQRPTDTSRDLFIDYVCEYGPSHRFFYADAFLTMQLAESISIHRLRRDFYQGGGQTLEGLKAFDNREFLEATIDSLRQKWWDFIRSPFDITHFMGSYDYHITRVAIDHDKIRYEIHNVTDLSSGTRIPPILGGVEVDDEIAVSVEELLLRDPSLGSKDILFLMREYPVISILSSRNRDQTTGLQGGGTMEQTFIWYENYPLLGCSQTLPALPPASLTIDDGGSGGGSAGFGPIGVMIN